MVLDLGQIMMGKDVMVAIILKEDAFTLLILIKDCGEKRTNTKLD